MEEYSFKYGIYDSAMIDKVVTLFTKAFYWTNKFSKEYLEWQYLKNPNGTVVSFNAFSEDGTLAAHYAAIPVKMRLNGKEEIGLLSVNTATHPNHQGKKLFTRLATKAYKYAQENGYKFIVGVANANSTHGFLKHLGFYLVSPLEFKVGFGNIFKKGIYENKNRFSYDLETLQWRIHCPAYDYYTSKGILYSNRPEPFFHSCVALLPDGVDGKTLNLQRDNNIFNIYVGLGVQPKSGLYFNIPKFIKRSPFNLVFKDLTGGSLPVLTSENIFFQLLDFDVA